MANLGMAWARPLQAPEPEPGLRRLRHERSRRQNRAPYQRCAWCDGGLPDAALGCGARRMACA